MKGAAKSRSLFPPIAPVMAWTIGTLTIATLTITTLRKAALYSILTDEL